MAGQQPTVVGQTTREYLRKFPAASTKSLARMLRKSEPALYKTVEDARASVNYYRGKCGARHREQSKRAQTIIPKLTLPDARPEHYQVVNLPEGVGRWLILADAHIPYHDRRAIHAVVKWARARENHCDGLILLGDIFDCYAMSSWLKDPREVDFPGELEAGKQFLSYLAEQLKPKCQVWKLGNHEYRLDRYLMSRAPELFGMEQFTIAGFLDAEKRGIQIVQWPNPLRYHALTLLHGDEWGRGASNLVNPARTAFLRTHDCTIVGHFHQTSEHTEKTARDTTITCWSVGALCGLHPLYHPMNKWNHGFAVLNTRGNWRVENHRIIDGEVR